jgi:hypothetical protein
MDVTAHHVGCRLNGSMDCYLGDDIRKYFASFIIFNSHIASYLDLEHDFGVISENHPHHYGTRINQQSEFSRNALKITFHFH